MNLRVFYLYKTVGFGWLLMCGRKRFKFEVEKIVTGRENCNGSRNLYRSKGENLQFLAYRSSLFFPFPMIEWLLLAAL